MMKYYPHTVTSMCTMTLRGWGIVFVFLRESRLQEVSKFKFSILVVNKPLFPEKEALKI